MSSGVGCHFLLRIRTTHCIFRTMLSINSQPFRVAGGTRITPISQEKWGLEKVRRLVREPLASKKWNLGLQTSDQVLCKNRSKEWCILEKCVSVLNQLPVPKFFISSTIFLFFFWAAWLPHLCLFVPHYFMLVLWGHIKIVFEFFFFFPSCIPTISGCLCWCQMCIWHVYGSL